MKTDLGPNFSIILPGPCNARCAFCFWKHKPVVDNYLDQLDQVLSSLPARFRQCSITGGEPTLSPYLVPVLERCRQRFDKLVLTTNGAKLDEHLGVLGCLDALNISRHHWTDVENDRVFGARMTPKHHLWGLISEMERRGVPVTLSCVLPSDATSEWCLQYIAHAKDVGAAQVFFRAEHGTLEIHPAEAGFQDRWWMESRCPVCINRSSRVMGLPVSFKYGTLEPSSDLGEVYEAIFHPSGKLTTDWAGEREFVLKSEHLQTSADSCRTSGCGQTSSGSGYGCRSTGC